MPGGPDTRPSGDGGDGDLTSFHARRAIGGEEDSRNWIIDHFDPVLQLQARYRLPGAVRSYYDPEDLVNDVWTVTLQRLPHLEPRDGRWTPVLVKFLSKTLFHKANHVLRRYARGDRPQREASIVATSGSPPQIEQLAADVSDVRTRAERQEARETLRECMKKLGKLDREILVLRGIEQMTNKQVAEKLGLSPSAVSMRFKRALRRASEALPKSAFRDLGEDD